MRGPLLAGFEKSLVDRGDETAIFALSEGRKLSFRDLAIEADHIKAAFAESGVPAGSCVLELVGNRASWFALLLACLDRGHTLVSLGAEASSAEVAKLRSRYRVSAIVQSAARPGLSGRGAAASILPGKLQLIALERDNPTRFEDTLFLKLTSGSSGEPKAVVVSEANLWNDGRHVVEAMGIRTNDVNYGVIPLSHSYGLGNLVAPLLTQGTPLALRQLFLPAQLGEDARVTSLSVLPGVPFLFEQVLNQLRGRGALPPTLRLLITAGARIDPDLVTSFKKELGPKIHSFYGSSETGGITYDDEDEVSDPLTVGKALPETAVTIRRDERVHVRGNAVAPGYVETSDDPTGTFVDSGFLSGDMGAFDDHGRLFLTGRLSSFVNVAGRKVNPTETESVLRTMPDVADAKVLGLPCDKRGQKLVAFIVPRSPHLNPLDVRSYCAEKLSPYKIPRDLILLEAIPLTDRGKVDRKALEALMPKNS
jgi:long-chain acyl-CoA synthetase